LGKKNFVCTGCHKKYPLDRMFPRCDECFEPLEVEITPGEKFEKKILSPHDDIFDQDILDRYASFYSLSQVNHQLSLKEGFTPLIQANIIIRGRSKVLFM